MKQALLRRLPSKAVERIAAGKQRYLFFRSVPRRKIDRIVCFEDDTLPLATIEMLPGELHSGDVTELTDLLFRFSGMSRNEWNAFWAGKSGGAALEIGTQCVIPEPLRFNVVQHWRLNQPPQNFCYVPCPSWPLARPDVNKQPVIESGNLF